jgi:hypothetical protein
MEDPACGAKTSRTKIINTIIKMADNACKDVIPKGTYLPLFHFADSDGIKESNKCTLIPSWVSGGLFPFNDDGANETTTALKDLLTSRIHIIAIWNSWLLARFETVMSAVAMHFGLIQCITLALSHHGHTLSVLLQILCHSSLASMLHSL